MAATVTISPKELQRQAELALEGKTIEVMLCSVGISGYGLNTTVEDWESVEISGNGYSRFTDTVQVGEYNNSAGRYVIPNIEAAFSATGAGYTYDRVILFFTGETYIHSIITENPNIALIGGQTQTYLISLAQDD